MGDSEKKHVCGRWVFVPCVCVSTSTSYVCSLNRSEHTHNIKNICIVPSARQNKVRMRDYLLSSVEAVCYYVSAFVIIGIIYVAFTRLESELSFKL